jgi:mono/diheme cytochrome c family protein
MEHKMILTPALTRRVRRSFFLFTELGLAALLFGLTCTCALAVEPTPKTPAAKRGSEIFHKRCIVCHNKQPDDTSPFGPPNLYAVFRGKPKITTAQAQTIIMNGKGQMPSFKAVLTKDEILSVLAYLRSK